MGAHLASLARALDDVELAEDALEEAFATAPQLAAQPAERAFLERRLAEAKLGT